MISIIVCIPCVGTSATLHLQYHFGQKLTHHTHAAKDQVDVALAYSIVQQNN